MPPLSTDSSPPITFFLRTGPTAPPPPGALGGALVEIAFGIDVTAAPAPSDWVDVTRQVRSLSFQTPTRNRDLDLFSPGTATVVLNNRDRRFDPTFASSPYWPKVVPLVRLRISYKDATNNITPLFTGLVEGWPQTSVQNKDATVSVRCVDGFNLLARARTMLSPWKMSVRGDNPSAWWRLDDVQGSGVALDSVAGRNGTYQRGPALGEPNLVAFDPGTSVLFSSGQQYIDLPTAAGPTGTAWTFETWVKLPSLPTNVTYFPIWWFGRASGPIDATALTWAPTGTISVQTTWPGDVPRTMPGPGGIGFPSANPAAIHHFALVRNGSVLTLYVDGVQAGAMSVSATHIQASPTIHRLAADNASPFLGPGVLASNPGILADAVFYDGQALTQPNIVDHYSSGVKGWDGDRTGDRVNRILDYVGWPAGLRNVDTGLSVLGPPTWSEGQQPLSYMQELAQTEFGALYIDPTGSVRFRDRQTLLTGPRQTTPVTTMKDARAFNIPYTDIQLSEDWQEIFNQVEITRVGGKMQVASDLGSQAKNGVLTLSRTNTLHRTDNEALDHANYFLKRRRDPHTRVNNITTKMGTSPGGFGAVVSLLLEDRVTVKRTPQGITPEITQDCWIEGFTHTVDAKAPLNWTVTLMLGDAPSATSGFFVFDVSSFNGPDVLGF